MGFNQFPQVQKHSKKYKYITVHFWIVAPGILSNDGRLKVHIYQN